MSDPAPTCPDCPECGSLNIRAVSGPGRKKTILGVTFEIPADLAIPTCPDCGSRWLDGPMTDAIDAAYQTARTAQQVPRTGTSG
jgi:transposase-like protein